MGIHQLANLLPSIHLEVDALVQDSVNGMLSSNYYAPLTDHNNIRHVILSLSSAMAQLDDAISTLSECRQKLDRSLLYHRRSISALARIPPEVMSIVFRHAAVKTVRYQKQGKTEPSFYGSGIAQSFAQVCRRWRQIALATPSIWNKIHLNWKCSLERPLELLSRADYSPIHLTIRVNLTVDRFAQGCADGLLEPFRQKCRALTIAEGSWRYSVLDEHNTAKILGAFPHLEQLTLTELGLNHRAFSSTGVRDRLTRLRLKISKRHDADALFGAPWVHLKSLVVDEMPTFRIEDESLVEHFPLLEDLFVDTHELSVASRVSGGPASLTLENLRVLGISVVNDMGKDTANLLDLLHLPSLKTLVYPAKGIDRVEHLARFVEASGCHSAEIELLVDPWESSTTQRDDWVGYFRNASTYSGFTWWTSPVFRRYIEGWWEK